MSELNRVGNKLVGVIWSRGLSWPLVVQRRGVQALVVGT